MAKLTLMQGLPASGKSTRAAEILKAAGNCVRVNKDLLRTMLHFDKFTGINEGKTQEAALEIAGYFLEKNVNVIIDDTNLNKKVVDGWKALAKAGEHKFEIVKMDTAVQECIIRDNHREKQVGGTVIKNMARQYKIKYSERPDVIVDLDGTLADISHRLHFVKDPEKKDWKSFFEAIPGDVLRKDVVDQVKQYADECNIVIVSARPENYKKETIAWLSANLEDTGFPIDTLIMRRGGDSREDSEIKKEILEKYFDKEKVRAVFDDRPRVIRMWEAQGLKVIDVGKGIEF